MYSLKEKSNVTQSDSNAIFKFGNGRSIKSGKVEIPVIIEDISVLLTTDVIFLIFHFIIIYQYCYWL